MYKTFLIVLCLFLVGCTFTYESQNRLKLNKAQALAYGSLEDGSILSDRKITIGVFSWKK